jgi:50S ribosomal subunit-associated GTPase HflX
MLTKRPFLIALNKIDIVGAEEAVELFIERFKRYKKNIFCISCETGEGIDALKHALFERVFTS